MRTPGVLTIPQPAKTQKAKVTCGQVAENRYSTTESSACQTLFVFFSKLTPCSSVCLNLRVTTNYMILQTVCQVSATRAQACARASEESAPHDSLRPERLVGWGSQVYARRRNTSNANSILSSTSNSIVVISIHSISTSSSTPPNSVAVARARATLEPLG